MHVKCLIMLNTWKYMEKCSTMTKIIFTPNPPNLLHHLPPPPLLGAACRRGMIQSKGIKIEGNATSDSMSVCTHVCSYT